MVLCVVIGLEPVFGRSGCGLGIPFEFVAYELSRSFFDPVEFFLVVCAPEIVVGVDLVVALFFEPFTDDKVFPELSGVVSKVWGVEVVDKGVSDTVVEEIIATGFGDFFS